LLRILRSSLCRWRFSAELLFFAKGNPQKNNGNYKPVTAT